VSDTVPINVGFVGSYAKKLFGDEIEVSLFKYPQSVIDAIKADPPDVLALSNYSWNSYLSERLAQLAKQANPDVVTVQGGNNFPHEASLYREFLVDRPHTDLHVELEGEVAFSNLIARVLAARKGDGQVLAGPIDGCVFIEPSTRFTSDPVVVAGVIPERLRELDAIPSPYLNGMLDHFFDGRLTPFIETNRGCPFKCTFCHTGNDYFQKTNMFSIERVVAEIEYIAPRASSWGIVNLHIADTNFGMYPRDREICSALREAHDKYAWPSQIMATTGKNNKERVIDITGIMGKMFTVTMSVQSMSPTVLANIKRGNIKLDHFTKVNEHLNEQGRATKGELIIGMPGETRESFLGGVEQMIESGISNLGLYTLMLLHGTEFKTPKYRKKHQIVGRFRIVPLDFGEYDGARVLDYEEVGVETKDMSFDDYLYLRSFALLVESLHNNRPFDEFFRYALSFGVSRFDMLRRIADSSEDRGEDVGKILRGFRAETREELWESAEELVAHYQRDENYERLCNGDVGGNVIFKYKAMSIVFAADGWISFLSKVCKEIAGEELEDASALQQEEERIDILSTFCRMKLAGILNLKGSVAPIEMESPYDVVGWLQSPERTPFGDFRTAGPIKYIFYFTEEQLLARADQFERYGTGINALSKVLTRVSNVESLFRKVKTPEGEEIIYADTDQDGFTRYGIAG